MERIVGVLHESNYSERCVVDGRMSLSKEVIKA
jgi:hypothetical protein